MDCRTTSTKPRWTARTERRSQAGMTLLELMIATAISAILSTSVAALIFYSNHSLAAMGNYVDLDHRSRIALDTMSRSIRQASRLTSYTTTSLTFEDSDGGTLIFSYDPSAKTLTRSKNGVADTDPLLEECDYLQFSIYQRNTIGGTYDQFSTASAATCKLVQLNWVCSRKILGAKVNTESVQSAKIVIRKQ
jgi:prepilin-type N-terminal cleavage/methylation domain-containing protein